METSLGLKPFLVSDVAAVTALSVGSAEALRLA